MTLLYIKRACELNKSHIISTDEYPFLRIESFSVINLRGVSTNKTIIIVILFRCVQYMLPSLFVYLFTYLHVYLHAYLFGLTIRMQDSLLDV